jgi:hypothetical protein
MIVRFCGGYGLRTVKRARARVRVATTQGEKTMRKTMIVPAIRAGVMSFGYDRPGCVPRERPSASVVAW